MWSLKRWDKCVIRLKKKKKKKWNFPTFQHTDIDYATRKLAKMLSPQKVIKQEGDSFTIKTVTAFRNYECSFTIGQEFTEVTSGMDNRSCQVKPAGNCCCVHRWKQTSTFSAPNIKARLFVIGQSVVTWDDNKLVCVQNGQKKNRGWTHWIEEDQLFLVRLSLIPGSWSLKVCHSCSVSPPPRNWPVRTMSADKFIKGSRDLWTDVWPLLLYDLSPLS